MILFKNNISNNNFGIYLSLRSSNNTIYLNDFSNNTKNVYYAYYSTNIWNSTSPFTYIYDGNPYTNYMGNYWSDYEGSDNNSDGIGDTPYIIDSDKDNYPLIERFEHYFVPTSTPTTIYVPDDYAKIQWAVDNASDGDTILVRDGVYVENVNVDKSLTIKSENGSANCIVQAANPNDHVFEVTADYVTISGFTVKGAISWKKAGIYLGSVKYCDIMNSEITYTEIGVELHNSSNCLIYNNNISNNKISSVDNGLSIWLNYSSYNKIINNTLYNDVCVSHSRSNIIASNTFQSSGIIVSDSYNNTVINNTVNGKPLVYLENESHKTITNAGQVILVNCSNITVKNIDLSNTAIGIDLWDTKYSSIVNNKISDSHHGIFIGYSSHNEIANNNLSNNNRGVELFFSGDNTVRNSIILNSSEGIVLGSSSSNNLINNTISSNNWGIYFLNSSNNEISNNVISNNEKGLYFIYYSNNNKIYLNNFINNAKNADSWGSTNIWNSTHQINYTYNGSQYTNYLGNHWSDYAGSDADGDGIGDTPYSIDGETDNYPLMQPWERYFPTTPTPIPVQTFDTGRPENPYPSISGKFVGTIRTNTTIIATKLYTYACEGTGGHTEYALIRNETWCAYAEWEGYKGDWMNISFNRTVILMPYETYNITIVTGSYPQIHHTSSLKTENGWINCTEFTDANGKKYENWIPAIKLWS